MVNGNMTDVAYNILFKKNKKMKFDKLWHDVRAKLKITDEEAEELIAEFYTSLTMDGRLVNLGNNEWDLRVHTKYDDIKTADDFDDDDDEIEEEDEGLDFPDMVNDYENNGEKFNLSDIEEESNEEEDY